MLHRALLRKPRRIPRSFASIGGEGSGLSFRESAVWIQLLLFRKPPAPEEEMTEERCFLQHNTALKPGQSHCCPDLPVADGYVIKLQKCMNRVPKS